jgi:hypothetical protein
MGLMLATLPIDQLKFGIAGAEGAPVVWTSTCVQPCGELILPKNPHRIGGKEPRPGPRFHMRAASPLQYNAANTVGQQQIT